MVRNGKFTLLLTYSGQDGNFTLLLTSSSQELLLASSGQEWQFHIATYIQWSGMAISHGYSHFVVKIGNFTWLLTSSSQEWQVHIAIHI